MFIYFWLFSFFRTEIASWQNEEIQSKRKQKKMEFRVIIST